MGSTLATNLHGESRNSAQDGAMASALCEPITEVWWQSPQRDPWAERDQGKLKDIHFFDALRGRNFAYCQRISREFWNSSNRASSQ